MPRFSANLGFLWPDRPLLARIDAAGNAGFKAIELHWPYEVAASKVKAVCAKTRVTLLAINTAVGDAAKGDFGLGAIPGREAEFQAAVDQSIAYCLDSGATMIHCMAGVVPAGKRDAATTVFADNLRSAAAKAGPQGLDLLLEPINSRDKPGYFYSTLAAAADMIERVGAPNIRLMFDVYHVAVSEGDVLKKLERYLPIIGHVQIAAVPSRAEPDEGEVAYRAVFDALDTLSYRGWVGCEYRPRGDTDEGLSWLKTLNVSL